MLIFRRKWQFCTFIFYWCKINFYWLQYIPLLCCDVGVVSELRLTAGCVLMELASPAVSGTSVYANGLSKISCIHCPYSETMYSRDAWILGTRSPRQLNFVWWHPVFVGPEYGTVFYIALLAPRMSRWLLDVQKICGPLLYSTLCATIPCISVLTSLSIIKWPPLFELLWYFFKCWHHIVF